MTANAKKWALITGITGQDGVSGRLRQSRSRHLPPHLPYVAGRLAELGIADQVEASNIRHVLQKLKPHEIYNPAADANLQLIEMMAGADHDRVKTGRLGTALGGRGYLIIRWHAAKNPSRAILHLLAHWANPSQPKTAHYKDGIIFR